MKTYSYPKPDLWPKICERTAFDVPITKELCRQIFADVYKRRDESLRTYTKKFDGVDLSSIVSADADLKKWADKTPMALRIAINLAAENIKKFHLAQKTDILQETVSTMPGVVCWRESRPVERVGLYVPGGSAPLVSTVLMLGIPAKLAGCKEIVLCTPPSVGEKLAPAICYAALLVGATTVVNVGGIQAIAALSLGTESVPKVDKIFGPGNQFVTTAKQFAGEYGVAIDMPAGPSEVMVIADNSANPAFVAADILSQAEHGPDSQAVLVSTEDVLIAAVKKLLKLQSQGLPRKDIVRAALENSYIVKLGSIDEAIKFANTYAPEHLILNIKDAEKVVSEISNAGSVFLGNYSPESAGDYASGTNHTLPTGGWARSYGGVSLDSFVKKVTFQSLSYKGLKSLAPTITAIAEAEGLRAHAEAVRIRLRKNKV